MKALTKAKAQRGLRTRGQDCPDAEAELVARFHIVVFEGRFVRDAANEGERILTFDCIQRASQLVEAAAEQDVAVSTLPGAGTPGQPSDQVRPPTAILTQQGLGHTHADVAHAVAAPVDLLTLQTAHFGYRRLIHVTVRQADFDLRVEGHADAQNLAALEFIAADILLCDEGRAVFGEQYGYAPFPPGVAEAGLDFGLP